MINMNAVIDPYDGQTMIGQYEGPDGRDARRALFAAICNEPNTDDPKLQYADYLEEFADNCPSYDPSCRDGERATHAAHGKLARDHAELIRLQIGVQRGTRCEKCHNTGHSGYFRGYPCDCGIRQKLSRITQIATALVPEWSVGKYAKVRCMAPRDMRLFLSDCLYRLCWHVEDARVILQGGFVMAFNCSKSFWRYHGPAVVTRCPVAGVLLADVEPAVVPFRLESVNRYRIACVNDDRFLDYQGEWQKAVSRWTDEGGPFPSLPSPSLTEEENEVTPIGYYVPSAWSDHLFHFGVWRKWMGELVMDCRSASEANRSIDRAAVQWARDEAGLAIVKPDTLENTNGEHNLREQLLAQPLKGTGTGTATRQ
jgi:uncharacterized protein (TIGR02996 family)